MDFLCINSRFPEGAADDRCQWQMKGGMPYTEYETNTNNMKCESVTRCGKAIGTFSGIA